MYDIIIIGAGPAGLSAALYARGAMKKVLVLEALNYGGAIVNTLKIANYPTIASISGFDFATNFYNQVKNLGAEIKFEEVLKLENLKSYKKIVTNQNVYETKTVIIATGCKNKNLGLENEEKFIGNGISYCATCDGLFFQNKEVAIVGGGNTAVQDALYLTDICKKVYLILRKNNFRAEASLVSKLKEKKNIEFIYNSNITKINGSDSLESIEYIDDKKQKYDLKISALFIAIGRVPQNETFKNIIEIDDDGYILSDENCHTNIDGIYVAGDCRKKDLRQLVTATSDGAIAAIEAINYLNN